MSRRVTPVWRCCSATSTGADRAQGWDGVAHDHLASAVADPAGGPGPRLLRACTAAWPVVGCAARELSSRGTRYRRLLARLHEALLPQSWSQANDLVGRHGVPVWSFDLIVGLTGIGVYLLEPGAADGPTAVELEPALRGVLSALVALTAEEDGLPGCVHARRGRSPTTPSP